MLIVSNYVDCNAFIHDKDGKNIACTTVLKHNRSDMTIAINGSLPGVNDSDVMSVMILATNGIHEYSAKLRKTLSGTSTTTISLFGGQVKKDSRISQRYTVNTSACVDGLLVDRKQIPLLKPLDVTVVNLSSSGALINTKPDYFTMDSVLALVINIGEQPTKIYGKVVRVNNIDDTATEYGCEFVSHDSLNRKVEAED